MQTSPGTQTRVHVAFAAVVSAVLIGLIMIVPACNRFMLARSKRAIQMAARGDLELVAKREAEFFSRNGFYTTDLNALQIGQGKKLMVLYKFGFVRPSREGEKSAKLANGETVVLDPACSDIERLSQAQPKLGIELSPVTNLHEIEFANLASYCSDCSATRSKFRAIAAANLDDDPTLDIWTIDEREVINHVVDDLGE